MRLLHLMADHLSLHFQLTLAAITGIGATLADSVTEATGWQDMGWKGLLIGALVWTVNLLLTQQKEHKLEAEKREEILLAHIDKGNEAMRTQAEGMAKLVDATNRQTGYFETVTRRIVDERLSERKTIADIANEKLPLP